MRTPPAAPDVSGSLFILAELKELVLELALELVLSKRPMLTLTLTTTGTLVSSILHCIVG